MELRFGAARATRDIDLTIQEPRMHAFDDGPVSILGALQDAAGRDLGDFFVFEVGQPVADLDGAPSGGSRFPVVARMDGRPFIRFHLDVGLGDAVLSPIEMIDGPSWLAFAGHPPRRFPSISREQQFAEKLHAYTLPREHPNSRVKDLVDMVLLIESGTLQPEHLLACIDVTFTRRATHTLPERLDAPPAAWKQPFDALAAECGITAGIEAAFDRVKIHFASLVG